MGAIDLGRIDPSHWRVLVGETVYGPYTMGQLRGFAETDRITSDTRIAAGDGAPFRPAITIPQLQPVFASLAGAPAPQPSDGNFLIVTRPRPGHAANSDDEDKTPEALNAIGRFMELSSGVYILRTGERLATVHRQLRQSVGEAAEIIIVDASEDRLAWLNLDADSAAVRDLWKPKTDR